MNRIIILLILIFNTCFIYGQILTKEEAYILADKLYEIQILSDEGRKDLRSKIEGNNFERYKSPNLSDGSIEVVKGFSRSQILIYLSKAFRIDLEYRSGSLESIELYEKLLEENGNTPFTEEDQEMLKSKSDSLIQNILGPKIEEAIKDEENFPEDVRRTSFISYGLPKYQKFDLINHKRSVFGKTCTRTLKDLFAIGLINDVIFKEVKEKIENFELTIESEVLSYASERAIFYEDFDENKSKEESFIKTLNKVEIISNDSLKKILSVENSKKLFQKYELIKYCNNAKTFHLNKYPVKPDDAYLKIYEEIKLIIPEFIFNNFQAKVFEVENDWGGDLIEYRASISFEVKGRKYLNEFFYDYKKKDEQEIDTLLKIHNDFANGVNKYLADLNSDYRLYYANKSWGGNSVYGQNEFGLILLTEEQFKAWGTYNSDYFLFSQSHDNSFNSENIEKIITEYENIGLFDHLNDTEKEQAKNCVSKSEIDSYQSILLCFPKTIVYFDWETGNLENPYEELTTEFSEASRGAFTPINIIDEFESSWEKETVNYAFEFEGTLYQETLQMNSDWLDPMFMELIENAIKENNVKGKIYYCLDNGQAAGYIFLTSSQYKFLKKNQPELFPEW